MAFYRAEGLRGPSEASKDQFVREDRLKNAPFEKHNKRLYALGFYAGPLFFGVAPFRLFFPRTFLGTSMFRVGK